MAEQWPDRRHLSAADKQALQEMAADALRRNQALSFPARLWGHTLTVLRHKFWVFRYCVTAGIPWQGLCHDLSKFSRFEFWESVRYYNGRYSPIMVCKLLNDGFSLAWLHHHGRNLHHYEAWHDDFDRGVHPIDMLYPYAVEMVCDFLGAGHAYLRSAFTYQKEYVWWQGKRRRGVAMTPHMQTFVEGTLRRIAQENSLAALRPAATRAWYAKCVAGEVNL